MPDALRYEHEQKPAPVKKQIEVSEEMYNALINLSTEISAQNHRSTAMPYFFQVREDEKVYDTGLNGDTLIFLTQDFDKFPLTPEGVIDFCNNHEIEIPADVQDIDQYHEFFDKHKLVISSYSIKDKLSNAFFTARACQEHIKANAYHYTRPTDYLSHTSRNPEMELIYKFLCGITGKEIHK